MSSDRSISAPGFASEDQEPYDHHCPGGSESADAVLDRLQRQHCGPEGLIGEVCRRHPRDFRKIAEHAVVLWYAFRLRERRARVLRAACRTYVSLRSAEPYAQAPKVAQAPIMYRGAAEPKAD